MLARLARLLLLLHLFALSAVAAADRAISEDQLYDKLRGMWIGQLIGNATGRFTEGVYDGPAPDPASSVPWVTKQVWDADDDTDIEYLAVHVIETYGFDCNAYEITGQWIDHLTADGIYIANRQAWFLMHDGYLPPATGSRAYNQHWYSIDAQIGTEVLGALSPGLPQTAMDLAGRFARVTNDGFAVHAGQFYAAMYAQAFLEPNVTTLVSDALAALPPGSRTANVIADVLDWYRQDAADGVLDWRATRRRLYDEYQGAASFGRYYNWVESTINTGTTVLALLYGRGDFKETIQIAVLAGWDCDCNPATAGGLLGIIHGFDGLPADLTDPAVCGDEYLNVFRPGLPEAAAPLPQSESISQLATRMVALAAENILSNGGHCRNGRFTRFYYLPAAQIVSSDPDNHAPIGRPALLAAAVAAGVTVTPNASVARRNPTRDRSNLDSIIDGVTSNALNGHRPYYTYQADPAARPPVDWYELVFSAPVCFDGVTFYEGDLLWSKINAYYRDDQPRGGFFEDLTVEVRQQGQYVQPSNILMSPDLRQYAMYQTISFHFTPTLGDAIRIVGTPGGTDRFTTILELVPEGSLHDCPPEPIEPDPDRPAD